MSDDDFTDVPVEAPVEAPEGSVEAPEGDEYVDHTITPEAYQELEGRYKSLEQAFSKATENKAAMTQELSQTVQEATRAAQALQDQLSGSQAASQQRAMGLQSRLQELSSIDVAQLDQESRVALNHEAAVLQQQLQYESGISSQLEMQRQAVMYENQQQQAAWGREVLKRTIPDWGEEKFRNIAKVAADYGYSQQEIATTTDPRLIRLLNAEYERNMASQAVSTRVAKNKVKPPRGAGARPEGMTGNRGEVKRAAQEFESAPAGSKGAFAAMKAAQLRSERNNN